MPRPLLQDASHPLISLHTLMLIFPKFQAALHAVELAIEADNANPTVRRSPYTYLLPTQIPQVRN